MRRDFIGSGKQSQGNSLRCALLIDTSGRLVPAAEINLDFLALLTDCFLMALSCFFGCFLISGLPASSMLVILSLILLSSSQFSFRLLVLSPSRSFALSLFRPLPPLRLSCCWSVDSAPSYPRRAMAGASCGAVACRKWLL